MELRNVACLRIHSKVADLNHDFLKIKFMIYLILEYSFDFILFFYSTSKNWGKTENIIQIVDGEESNTENIGRRNSCIG